MTHKLRVGLIRTTATVPFEFRLERAASPAANYRERSMTTTMGRREFIVIAIPTCAFEGCESTTRRGNTASSSLSVTVSIAPSSGNVRLCRSQQFTGTASGSTNLTRRWAASGIPSGNESVGTISAPGFYQAPSALPVRPWPRDRQSGITTRSDCSAAVTWAGTTTGFSNLGSTPSPLVTY